MGHDEGRDGRKGSSESSPQFASPIITCLSFSFTHCLKFLNKSLRNLPPMYESWIPILASLLTSVILKQAAWLYGKGCNTGSYSSKPGSPISGWVFLGKCLNLICKLKLSPRSFPNLKSLWICEVFAFVITMGRLLVFYIAAWINHRS